MIFTAKKFISALLMPLSTSLLLAVAGLILLLLTNRKKTGKALLSMGILLLLLFSNLLFASSILSPLENSYPKYLKPDYFIKYVVVLGHGHVSNPGHPLSSQISSEGLTRLAEGIRIFRDNQGSRLILSGYSGADTKSHAEMLAEVAGSLGIAREDMILEPRPKDTKDEARIIKDIVKEDGFALVTSAVHMKRSVALFKKQGLNPLPAPTYFQSRKISKFLTMPSINALRRSEIAFHEHLGYLWATLRGQV